MFIHEAIKDNPGGRWKLPQWGNAYVYVDDNVLKLHRTDGIAEPYILNGYTLTTDDWEVVATDIQVGDVVGDVGTIYTPGLKFRVEYIAPNNCVALSIVGSGLLAESRPLDRLAKLISRPEKPYRTEACKTCTLYTTEEPTEPIITLADPDDCEVCREKDLAPDNCPHEACPHHPVYKKQRVAEAERMAAYPQKPQLEDTDDEGEE